MSRNKTILLTGITGQVGHTLRSRLAAIGNVVAVSRKQLDLRSADDIRTMVKTIQPDIIINPAAYTAVDLAESNPSLAHAINGTAPRILAEEAERCGALLIHYSTDYIFDGTSTVPYVETDTPNPLGVYGKSKLAGEFAIQATDAQHLILRTSWVYGNYGKNFMLTMLNLAADRESLQVVADQFGAPTSSACIAEATVEIIKRWDPQKVGTYHLTNAGQTSWHGFCTKILSQYEALSSTLAWPMLKIKASQVQALASSDYPTIAARPHYSVLNNQKLQTSFGIALPDWQIELERVLSTRNSA